MTVPSSHEAKSDSSLIRFSRELASNEIDESELRDEKDWTGRVSHCGESQLIEGMNHQKTGSQFVSVVNFTRTKHMKVSHKMLNTMNQETQHFEGSQ
jgi:hypothetical protein